MRRIADFGISHRPELICSVGGLLCAEDVGERVSRTFGKCRDRVSEQLHPFLERRRPDRRRRRALWPERVDREGGEGGRTAYASLEGVEGENRGVFRGGTNRGPPRRLDRWREPGAAASVPIEQAQPSGEELAGFASGAVVDRTIRGRTMGGGPDFTSPVWAGNFRRGEGTLDSLLRLRLFLRGSRQHHAEASQQIVDQHRARPFGRLAQTISGCASLDT